MPNEIADNSNNNDGEKAKDGIAHAFVVEAIKVEHLGNDKENDADFGGIVGGENAVGNKRSEHSRNEKAVFGEELHYIN